MVGEGEYNLNTLKEVKVTSTFLDLDSEARGCQMKEPFEQCTTRMTIGNIVEKCKCLPADININDQVGFSF